MNITCARASHAIGCQLCAPCALGMTNTALPVLSNRASGFSIGLPVTGSSPVAQFTGT
jgi:hypothetical protein